MSGEGQSSKKRPPASAPHLAASDDADGPSPRKRKPAAETGTKSGATFSSSVSPTGVTSPVVQPKSKPKPKPTPTPTPTPSDKASAGAKQVEVLSPETRLQIQWVLTNDSGVDVLDWWGCSVVRQTGLITTILYDKKNGIDAVEAKVIVLKTGKVYDMAEKTTLPWRYEDHAKPDQEEVTFSLLDLLYDQAEAEAEADASSPSSASSGTASSSPSSGRAAASANGSIRSLHDAGLKALQSYSGQNSVEIATRSRNWIDYAKKRLGDLLKQHGPTYCITKDDVKEISEDFTALCKGNGR